MVSRIMILRYLNGELLLEVTEKGLVGWDNEARGTELGRLHRVNNRNEYHSNKISTPNRPFSVTSLEQILKKQLTHPR